MCRFLAYSGVPIGIHTLTHDKRYSLVKQAAGCREGKMLYNKDGCGVAWYGSGRVPYLYRSPLSATEDFDFMDVAWSVRSRLFISHVRAATDTSNTEANSHPFTYKRYAFAHNGQIPHFELVKDDIEALLTDKMLQNQQGDTDSELLFLLIMQAIEAGEDPVSAIFAAMGEVKTVLSMNGVQESLRFAGVLSDGEKLYVIRLSEGDAAPSLYARRDKRGAIIASEPLDRSKRWIKIPEKTIIVI